MESPDTLKFACTPKENTSGVAGITIAAPLPLLFGTITGVYTVTDWNS